MKKIALAMLLGLGFMVVGCDTTPPKPTGSTKPAAVDTAKKAMDAPAPVAPADKKDK